jgi:hypothetical protein
MRNLEEGTRAASEQHIEEVHGVKMYIYYGEEVVNNVLYDI